MRFGAILDHLKVILDHFEKSKIFPFLHDFGHFLPIFGYFWPILGLILTLLAPQIAPKWRWNWPKCTQNGCKSPKNALWAILDRLEAISIPSVSISKGIKNKNFDRFPVPRWVPPLALIGWQRAPL